MSPRSLIIILSLATMLLSCATGPAIQHQPESGGIKTGNVIFIHPDGTGANTWNALRAIKVGPDSMLNWDYMDHMGVYRGHQRDVLGTSSNAGATAHAYGVKVKYHDYGIHPDHPITSLSGKPLSIMHEAQAAGMPVAVINSGHINEPGTGAFLASAASRSHNDELSKKIILSGADIILGGGEKLLLPEGVQGLYGEGARKDGENMIELAKSEGYTIVYNREELLALPSSVEKVLGVFAYIHTFDDRNEEELAADNNAPLYYPQVPSLAEMIETALRILETRPEPFLMVVEEEGPDNFGNYLNASGVFESLGRADEGIGVVMKFIDKQPNTLLVTAADSDAGGLQIDFIREKNYGKPVPLETSSGATIDGKDGAGSLPFTAKPDQYGKSFEFFVCWATSYDMYGGVIAKAHGLNSDLLPNNVDNTDIYRIIYATLFGEWLD